MGSKTISRDDDAYARLSAAKRPGESFSDVVKRLTAHGRPSFLRLSGLLSKSKADRLAEAIAEMTDEDVREQAKRDRRWL